MSHFVTVETQFKDKDCLLKALQEVQWSLDQIEINDTPRHLYGYKGDQREQTAEIIIRRKYVGGLSNDIGFVWDPQKGAYQVIISEYDQNRYGPEWRGRLTQTYSRFLIEKIARARGKRFSYQKEPNGSIKVVLDA